RRSSDLYTRSKNGGKGQENFVHVLWVKYSHRLPKMSESVGVLHHNTMFTIFLGTTITFLEVFPSNHFWTISFSKAIASISSLNMLTESCNFTLTLPLMDTGYS